MRQAARARTGALTLLGAAGLLVAQLPAPIAKGAGGAQVPLLPPALLGDLQAAAPVCRGEAQVGPNWLLWKAIAIGVVAIAAGAVAVRR